MQTMRKPKLSFANKALLFLIGITAVFLGCQKTNPVSPRQYHRTVTDTLLVYDQYQQASGKWDVFLKDYADGTIKPLLFNATYPFATNLRIVYIKGDSAIGFINLKGIAKFETTLPHAKYPQLSLDTRLICVVDQPDSNTYQLLKFDTLGVSTVLFATQYPITYPSFSSDGTKIAFTQVTKKGSSSIFLVYIDDQGHTEHRVTQEDSTFYDDYPTITNETIYFVRSHMISGTLSSEIFASDLGGSRITQLTNFTNNWTTPGFSIKDLRKVANLIDTTRLVCVSDYKNSGNSNIYLYKIGTDSLERVTNTGFMEASPSMIPNYIKNN
jgi:hypothetical protein